MMKSNQMNQVQIMSKLFAHVAIQDISQLSLKRHARFQGEFVMTLIVFDVPPQVHFAQLLSKGKPRLMPLNSKLLWLLLFESTNLTKEGIL